MKRPIPDPPVDHICDHCFSKVIPTDHIILKAKGETQNANPQFLDFGRHEIELAFCNQKCLLRFLLEHRP